MLIPRRTKFRKQHRPHRTGLSKGGNQLAFGDYGIQALEPAYITNRQIEAARIAMTRHIKRGGKVWINIFPDRPLTKKPAETRMGSGKGAPEWWIANVKPGRIMFELAGVPESLAREAMSRAQHKLPMKTRFVTREGGDNWWLSVPRILRPPTWTVWTTSVRLRSSPRLRPSFSTCVLPLPPVS